MKLPAILLGSTLLLSPLPLTRGAGVTIITHGLNGNVTDWIIPMSQQIPAYDTFPGSAYSCYQITVDADFFHNFSVTQSRIGGVNPTNSDSGEILIKLDWSSLAVNPTYSTSDIADHVVPKLLATNFISELGGRALSEFPIHLIGHSRGGSVVTEMARLLGQQGVWVDHQTTLDPAPISGYGDADVHTYLNVLFADSYWQMNSDSSCPNGQALAGTYDRFLTTLPNGYSCDHSDTHLWYHGTIDWSHTPATDTDGTITSSERATWWTGYESQGHIAGFYYSLIGGGNRLSADEPAGAGTGRIRDGYNQVWDFGAGISANRAHLTSNGTWPSLIKFNVLNANPVIQGDNIFISYSFELSQATTESANVRVFLDNDANPYNGNLGQIFATIEPGAGTNVVQRQFSVNGSNIAPSQYYIYAQITYGAHTRYLYAPGKLIIRSPLTLEIVRFGPQVVINWLTNAAGFTLESTPDLLLPNSWLPVSPAPSISYGRNFVTNTIANGNQFYRLKK